MTLYKRTGTTSRVRLDRATEYAKVEMDIVIDWELLDRYFARKLAANTSGKAHVMSGIVKAKATKITRSVG